LYVSSPRRKVPPERETNMKNKWIVIGLVLGLTTSWALAQDSDRAPRRLASPRDSAEDQDQVRDENQRPKAKKADRREAKRMEKRQSRADLGPLPSGRGMGGPGFRGGQGPQAPGRGQALSRPWNAPQAGNARRAAVCPECGRPMGPFAGRGFGMGPQGAQGRGFGGQALGPNRQFGQGMGPYAWNNQRQRGPRAGVDPMNRPPLNNQDQFRGGRQFDSQERGPAMGPRGGGPGRQAPLLRENDVRPPMRDQDGPRRPNATRDLRDQDGPRPNRGDFDDSRPRDRGE
jgi:hypothetical protein